MTVTRKFAAAPAADSAVAPPWNIPWHSMWWVEGPRFLLNGYTGGIDVPVWPDEIGGNDLLTTRAPQFAGGFSELNNNKSVLFKDNEFVRTDDFVPPLSYPGAGITVVLVMATGSDASTANKFVFDGNNSTNRNALFRSVDNARVYAGSSTKTVTGVFPSLTGFLVAVRFQAGSADVEQLYLNDGFIISDEAGSHLINGLTFGSNAQLTSAAADNNMRIAFAAVLEGNVRADPGWTDFKAWVTSFYGISVF